MEVALGVVYICLIVPYIYAGCVAVEWMMMLNILSYDDAGI